MTGFWHTVIGAVLGTLIYRLFIRDWIRSRPWWPGAAERSQKR